MAVAIDGIRDPVAAIIAGRLDEHRAETVPTGVGDMLDRLRHGPEIAALHVARRAGAGGHRAETPAVADDVELATLLDRPGNVEGRRLVVENVHAGQLAQRSDGMID